MKYKYAIVLAFAVVVMASYSYAARINQPDLSVTDIGFVQLQNCNSTNATKYVNVQVTMYVTNSGNATAYNFTDRMVIAGTTYNFAVSSLAAGANTQHMQTVSRACRQQFSVNATADIYNSVAESNEANNNRIETFTPI